MNRRQLIGRFAAIAAAVAVAPAAKVEAAAAPKYPVTVSGGSTTTFDTFVYGHDGVTLTPQHIGRLWGDASRQFAESKLQIEMAEAYRRTHIRDLWNDGHICDCMYDAGYREGYVLTADDRFVPRIAEQSDGSDRMWSRY